MLPGMNPRKMQQMMKQLGIQQQEIPAVEVIIRTEDKEIIVTNPSVSKVNMMGQESFQVSGEVEERALSSTSSPSVAEEDIQTIMEQTGVDENKARQALEDNDGDLAAAIISLNKK
jgi:nascent polypeptide-associated complex subunit alpha